MLDNTTVTLAGQLTKQQLKIAQYIVDGFDNIKISRDLNIESEGLEAEIAEIYRILNIDESYTMHIKRNLLAMKLGFEVHQDQATKPQQDLLTQVSDEEGSVRTPRILPLDPKPSAEKQNSKSTFDMLPPRLLQVMRGIANDKSNHEIAQELGVETGTVSFHVSKLYTALSLPASLSGRERRRHVAALYREATGDQTKVPEQNTSPVECVESKNLPNPSYDEKRTAVGTDQTINTAAVADLLTKLRPLEMEVVEIIGNAPDSTITPAEIASQCNTVHSTVVYRLAQVYKKLGLPLSLGNKARRRLLAEAYKLTIKRKGQGEPYEQETEDIQANTQSSVRTTKTIESEEDCRTPIIERNVVPPVVQGSGTDRHPLPYPPPSVPAFGPPIALSLTDPASVDDFCVIVGRKDDPSRSEAIVKARRNGYQPERLVFYPTENPEVIYAYLICVKRI